MEQVLDVRTHVYMRNAISPLHLHDRVSELSFHAHVQLEYVKWDVVILYVRNVPYLLYACVKSQSYIK